MIIFLIFMWIVGFINLKQLLVIGIFEILCIINRNYRPRIKGDE